MDLCLSGVSSGVPIVPLPRVVDDTSLPSQQSTHEAALKAFQSFKNPACVKKIPITSSFLSYTKSLHNDESPATKLLYEQINGGNQAEFIRLCGVYTFTKNDVNSRSYDNKTLLCWAAEKGLLDVVKKLHELGAENSPDLDHKYPIDYATREGHDSVVKYLLENGAPPRDALITACEKQHKKCIKLLLKYNASPSEASGWGTHPIKAAYDNGNRKIFKLLLSYGADVKVLGDLNALVLKSAAKGHKKMLSFLISECGLNVNYKDPETGNTALFEAYKNHHKITVKKLKELGARTDIYNRAGMSYHLYGQENRQEAAFSAFHQATLSGQFKEKNWQKFMSDVYEINKCDKNRDKTFLHMAVSAEYMGSRYVKALIECGASPDVPNSRFVTPLHSAEKKLNKLKKEEDGSYKKTNVATLEEMIALMKKQSNPDLHNFYKAAAILKNTTHIDSDNYNELIQLPKLIEEMKDVNFTSAEGLTLLDIAIENHQYHLPYIIQLLRRGANPLLSLNRKNSYDSMKEKVNPHEWRLDSEDINEIIKKMEQSSKIDPAFIEQQKHILEVLAGHLLKGTMTDETWKEVGKIFDLSMPDEKGNTLLHYAIMGPKLNAKYFLDLLSKRAYLFILNHEGKTVMDLIMENKEIVEAAKKYDSHTFENEPIKRKISLVHMLKIIISTYAGIN